MAGRLTDWLLDVQGTEAINGLVTSIDVPADKDSGKYNINFMRYTAGTKAGVKDSEEFDLIIGSDGANSRVAKVRMWTFWASLGAECCLWPRLVQKAVESKYWPRVELKSKKHPCAILCQLNKWTLQYLHTSKYITSGFIQFNLWWLNNFQIAERARSRRFPPSHGSVWCFRSLCSFGQRQQPPHPLYIVITLYMKTCCIMRSAW